nr:hypothetical protein [Tanacetum cinerariifolium]
FFGVGEGGDALALNQVLAVGEPGPEQRHRPVAHGAQHLAALKHFYHRFLHQGVLGEVHHRPEPARNEHGIVEAGIDLAQRAAVVEARKAFTVPKLLLERVAGVVAIGGRRAAPERGKIDGIALL